MVREKERDLQQAKFFHNQLAKLVAKEENKSKQAQAHNHLQKLSGEIEELENREAMMLESL